jgi:hypothetical protein
VLRFIFDINPIKYLAEQCLNCWLGYVLSQPVEFDLTVLFYFMLEYAGIIRVSSLVKSICEMKGVTEIISIVVGRNREDISEDISSERIKSFS